MIIFIMMFAFSSNAFALLPPLYNSAEQIKGMLESSKLGQVLESGELIESIVRTDHGYEIITNKHRVNVTVTAAKQMMPGPAKYQYSFSVPEEK
ncbi:MAG: hypothetical protein Q8K75_12670 [Chlamydiales bacterium]|nr:hypothetical protein [Chlamydiales bacterium]